MHCIPACTFGKFHKKECCALLFYDRKLATGEEMYTAVLDLVEALEALSDSGSFDNQDELGEMETAVESPGKPFDIEQYAAGYFQQVFRVTMHSCLQLKSNKIQSKYIA